MLSDLKRKEEEQLLAIHIVMGYFVLYLVLYGLFASVLGTEEDEQRRKLVFDSLKLLTTGTDEDGQRRKLAFDSQLPRTGTVGDEQGRELHAFVSLILIIGSIVVVCYWKQHGVNVPLLLFGNNYGRANHEITEKMKSVNANSSSVHGACDDGFEKEFVREIKWILTRFPEAMQDDEREPMDSLSPLWRPMGLLLLSCGCDNNSKLSVRTTLDILKSMLEANQQQVTFGAKLQPIHAVCLFPTPRCIPLELVELMVVQEGEECLRQVFSYKNKKRYTHDVRTGPLLILALSHEYPNLDLVKFLYHKNPEAVKYRNEWSGELAIQAHLVKIQNRPSLLVSILETEPKLLQGKVLYYWLQSNNVGMSVLAFGQPVFELILEKNPALAKQKFKHNGGGLPLHHVRTLEQATSLLEAYPEAVSALDFEHCLPIHRVASLCNGVFRDQSDMAATTVLHLARLYPKGLLHRSNQSETPMDIIRRCFKICDEVDRRNVKHLLQTLIELRDEFIQSEKEKQESAVVDMTTWKSEVKRLNQVNEDLAKRVRQLETTQALL